MSGKKSELKKFKEHAKGDNGCLDFNRFVPYPEEYRKLDDAFWGALETIHRLEASLKDVKDEAVAEEIKAKIKSLRKTMPEKDGFNHGGYEWCVQNWGTKWNASEPELYEGRRSLHYTFATAWSPPLPAVVKMSEKFPELLFTLRYWEGGMGFQGVFKVKGGECLKDLCGDYRGYRGG